MSMRWTTVVLAVVPVFRATSVAKGGQVLGRFDLEIDIWSH